MRVPHWWPQFDHIHPAGTPTTKLRPATTASARRAQSWFPFQANRLVATLNFMLAVPVGQAIAVGLRALGKAVSGKGKAERRKRKGQRAKGKERGVVKAADSRGPK